MKPHRYNLIKFVLYILAILLQVPAVLATVDLWCWLVIGHNLTGRLWLLDKAFATLISSAISLVIIGSIQNQDKIYQAAHRVYSQPEEY